MRLQFSPCLLRKLWYHCLPLSIQLQFRPLPFLFSMQAPVSSCHQILTCHYGHIRDPCRRGRDRCRRAVPSFPVLLPSLSLLTKVLCLLAHLIRKQHSGFCLQFSHHSIFYLKIDTIKPLMPISQCKKSTLKLPVSNNCGCVLISL